MNEAKITKHPAEQYIEDVLAGKSITNRWVRLAVERHVDDLKNADAKAIWFNRDAGIWACDCFPKLFRHFKGALAGQPFELMPWQAFIVYSLFGWMKTGTALRRFRRAYIEVARKNGKTTLLAGIAIIMFLLDGEAGARVYSAATKRDQAKEVWDCAQKMIRTSPALRGRVTICHNSLADPAFGSTFIPLSADANTLDGLDISAAVVDELHAHPTSAVWDVLDTATGAREQPLICAITTAGFSQVGVCFELHNMIIELLNRNVENDSWFGFLAGLDDDDAFSDESVWEKANPNIRFIPTLLADLREKSIRASRSASQMNNFLVKCMCRWTSQGKRWLQVEHWDKCKAREPFDSEAMKARPAFGGIDYAEKLDLTAICLCFPPYGDDKKWRYLWRFYLPEDTVQQHTDNGDHRWQQWVASGELIATSGAVTDQQVVREDLMNWAEQFDLRQVGFDPWHMRTFASRLLEDSLEMVEVPPFPKDLAEATKEFEAQVVTQGLQHYSGSLMRWQIDNVTLKSDNRGNVTPQRNKRDANTKKIDGVMAAVTALSLAIRHPIEDSETSYAVFSL
jgi:phage terminase large subunit-like protein